MAFNIHFRLYRVFCIFIRAHSMGDDVRDLSDKNQRNSHVFCYPDTLDWRCTGDPANTDAIGRHRRSVHILVVYVQRYHPLGLYLVEDPGNKKQNFGGDRTELAVAKLS